MANSTPIEVTEINKIKIHTSGVNGEQILFLHPAGQLPAGMTEHIEQLSEVGRVIAPNLFDIISVLLREKEAPSFRGIANTLQELEIVDLQNKTHIVACSLGGGR